MSSLGDHIRQALTGGQEHITESVSFREKLQALRAEAGSRRAAAREAGVPESTWRRWERGSIPKAAGAGHIDRAVRAANISPNAPTDQTLSVRTFDRATGRNRSLSAEKLRLSPGTMDRVRDAYLRGDNEAAAREFVNGIREPWYRNYFAKGVIADRSAQGSGADDSGGGRDDGGDEESGDETGDYDYETSSDLAYEGGDVDSADSDPVAVVTGIG